MIRYGTAAVGLYLLYDLYFKVGTASVAITDNGAAFYMAKTGAYTNMSIVEFLTYVDLVSVIPFLVIVFVLFMVYQKFSR